ncbi:MAG: recombinase family protein [Armatimonadia bacterium]
MKRAAGYLRVSTATQAEHGLGLDIQREAITEYCQQQGFVLVDCYEDAGVSGANGIEDREAWPQLVDALEQKAFSVVIVLRLDRLARDLMLQETMLGNVQELGGELISIDEPDLCDGDPTRTMFRQIKGAISQYEKVMIVTRLKAGRRKKVRQGGYSGGWLPYGYSAEGQGPDAKPVVDGAAAAIVRRIFADYAKGNKSMKQIALELTAAEVPTARGGQWAQATVQAILSNPFYTGQVDEEGRVPRKGYEAVVTKRLFNRCQRRMEEARRGPSK